MTDVTTTEGSASVGAVPLSAIGQMQTVGWGGWLRHGLAALIVAGLLAGAYALHNTPGFGARAGFSLLVGAALGVVFERGRFCFFCILRDGIEARNTGPLYAVLVALAVGAVGYAAVLGAFLPNAIGGTRLPPGAHIGPVSWVLALAGLAFGVGMALSGACISGHLYRLGEGYSRAPIALVGALAGFGVGFFTWRALYVGTLAGAPVWWLPHWLGYGGALALHLAVLALIGVVLLRGLPPLPAQPGGALTLGGLHQRVLGERWHPALTGGLVGVLGVLAYFRVEPLGVTAQLGSFSRIALDRAGLLSGRLNGLDGFAGCATQVAQLIINNGWLVGGLVLGSLAAALAANRFQLSPLTPRNSATALVGGVLMGWGAMSALGCTVGTLLSGMSAFAISGWVFAATMTLGVWLGLRLGLHRL